jgi:hypothetical protein
MTNIRTLSKHIASHQAAVAIEKAKENVILLIDGFAGHKPLSVDCQYIDVGEGIKAYRWEFLLVIWFLQNATSYI